MDVKDRIANTQKIKKRFLLFMFRTLLYTFRQAYEKILTESSPLASHILIRKISVFTDMRRIGR